MPYTTGDRIFALVWIAVVPFALVLCMALTFVLCAVKKKTVDTVTSSLLVSRIIHTGGAVLMSALFILEHWLWTDTLCYIEMWFWISSWVADFLTTLLFLMFYAGRIARKSPRSTCYVTMLFLLAWVLAIVAGGVPFFVPSLFNNLSLNLCSVGLTISVNPIPHIVVGILGVGFLLFVVLIIALLAETSSKILIFWTSRKAEQKREDIHIAKSGETPSSSTSESSEQYWIQENGDVSGTATKAQRNPSNSRSRRPSIQDSLDTESIYEESTEWIRSSAAMKDVRNIVVTASCLTVLLEIIPQLVCHFIYL